ncbi:MAG: peptide chain release factor 2, partial [Defluviitoga tunisiensis]
MIEYEVKVKIDELKEKFEDLKKVFNLEKKQQEVKDLDNIMAQPEFWNDLEKAQKVSK